MIKVVENFYINYAGMMVLSVQDVKYCLLHGNKLIKDLFAQIVAIKQQLGVGGNEGFNND